MTGALLLLFVFAIESWYLEEGVPRTAAYYGSYLLLSYLFLCNILYFFARYGYFQRLKEHSPKPEEELEQRFAKEAPSLAILVPSYKEEIAIVRQTLISSALQEYPSRRVVLLIDDPAEPTSSKARAQLEKARALPGEIEAFLAPQRHALTNEWNKFLYRQEKGSHSAEQECELLAEVHDKVASWFERQVAITSVETHVDEAFVEITYRQRAEKHRRRAAEARKARWDAARIEQEYRLLAEAFTASVASFERKRYLNLSHAPNKAMNLNSYIGLMGESFVEVARGADLWLEKCSGDETATHIPNDAYIAVIDADSLLFRDYSSRLIDILEENQQIAVTQTFCTAFPDAESMVERVAGAQIDIAYMMQQGATHFNASFWVGANGIARKAALDEIAIHTEERGYPIVKYIEDRTVIEDTESGVDLIVKGWKVHSYPERLSYTAIPEDFGSLLIQRRRWANGGLLILPKLFSYLWKGSWSFKKLIEAPIRFQYLASRSLSLVALLLFFLCAPEMPHYFLWLTLFSLPVLLLNGWDLKLIGHRFSDLFRIIALDTLLLPVHAAGVVKSIEQMVTGKKIPFLRTPKVRNRTSVPSLYVLMETAMLFGAGWASHGTLATYGFTGSTCLYILFCAVPLVYGYAVFLGVRNNFEDLLPVWDRLGSWINRSVNESLVGYKESMNEVVRQLSPSVEPPISPSSSTSAGKGKG